MTRLLVAALTLAFGYSSHAHASPHEQDQLGFAQRRVLRVGITPSVASEYGHHTTGSDLGFVGDA